VDNLRFNTAISEMMVFANEATQAAVVPLDWFEAFVKVLSPFAPHVAEDLWERLGHTEGLSEAPWPPYDKAKLARDVITIAVQVGGRLRATVEVSADATDSEIVSAAKADETIRQFLAGRVIQREIYVKGRLVNLVL